MAFSFLFSWVCVCVYVCQRVVSSKNIIIDYSLSLSLSLSHTPFPTCFLCFVPYFCRLSIAFYDVLLTKSFGVATSRIRTMSMRHWGQWVERDGNSMALRFGTRPRSAPRHREDARVESPVTFVWNRFLCSICFSWFFSLVSLWIPKGRYQWKSLKWPGFNGALTFWSTVV